MVANWTVYLCLVEMNVIFYFIKQVSWRGFLYLFHALRSIIWYLNGTYSTIYRNQRHNRYKGTVQCLRILWKRKFLFDFDDYTEHDNFLLLHDSWVDPEYVLQDHVTLFFIDKDEALFVECPPDVIVSSLKCNAFMRDAQFEHANRVLSMPIHIFNKLTEKLGNPAGDVIFLTNTSWCGSTLLCQIFGDMPRAVAFSEPMCTNALTALEHKIPSYEYGKITRNLVRFLCKPLSFCPECLCWVIKLPFNQTWHVPHMVDAFPEGKHIFIYRDGLPTCKVRKFLYFQIFIFGDSFIYLCCAMVNFSGNFDLIHYISNSCQ